MPFACVATFQNFQCVQEITMAYNFPHRFFSFSGQKQSLFWKAYDSLNVSHHHEHFIFREHFKYKEQCFCDYKSISTKFVEFEMLCVQLDILTS